MDLNELLRNKFVNWKPPAPEVITRSNNTITLDWQLGNPFSFLGNQLLYRLEKREKIPGWVVAYSGGKTTKTIENLAPRHPHTFRLQVILKGSAINSLRESAIKHFGEEKTAYNNIARIGTIVCEGELNGNENIPEDNQKSLFRDNEVRYGSKNIGSLTRRIKYREKQWLESQWSEETWTSTDSDGTSAVCFCMAVRCGYIKQLQAMLEERPELINIASTNGLTPLATAIRKGDVNIIRYLLQAGADVNLPLSTGQTPLHLAVLAGNLLVIDILLDKEADFMAQDVNGLRVEHYAVDSCNLEVVKYILDKGGDLNVQDSNRWTPLFRAVCQGAATKVIEELILRGSSVDVTDRSGLRLAAAARLLKDKNGRRRESVLRLVDATFIHEKALEHFSRLTKKISSVQALLK